MLIWRSMGVKAIADALTVWANHEARRKGRAVDAPARTIYPSHEQPVAAGPAHGPSGRPDGLLKVVVTGGKEMR